MASLILGAIGGFVFGPLGFMIGSAIGNLLMPEKQSQTGPRLTDLKLQTSQYGKMIPILFGTIRCSNQVIWQTDLVEHKHTSGGKGGPQVTTYTYTASFACLLCEGPILGVTRIWADSRLIWSSIGNDPNFQKLTFTVYRGDSTQGPDPTMEAAQGAGNVPGYRGRAYIVFPDMDLSDYANRIPNLTFEVIATGTPHLQRLTLWGSEVPGNNAPFVGPVGITFNGQTIRVAIYTAYAGAAPSTYIQDEYDTAGNFIQNITPLTYIPVVTDRTSATSWKQVRNSNAAVMISVFNDAHTQVDWYADGVPTFSNLTTDQFLVASPGYYFNGYVYASSGGVSGPPPFLARWDAPLGVVDGNISATYTFEDGSNVPFNFDCTVDTLTGDVWAWGAHSVSGNGPVWHFDKDLNVIYHWPDGGTVQPPQFSNTGGVVVWGDFMVISTNSQEFLYTINSDHTFTLIDSYLTFSFTTSLAGVGGGYFMTNDGLFKIGLPCTLASIVQAISERAGLLDAQMDVTALYDLVDGYALTAQGTARAGVQPLQQAWFFDAVESDLVVKFVKRGGIPVLTAADADLGAFAGGSQPPALVTTQRAKEVDLPKVVNVTYLNIGADYEDGTQVGQRILTTSELKIDEQLAIVMDDLFAKSVADRTVFSAWLEREAFTFSTPRKYAYLEPCDVLVVHGNTIRLTKRTEQTDFVIKWEGVATLSQIFNQAAVAAPASGFVPTVPPVSQLTDLMLLDIPIVVDTDFAAGFYAAMAGHTSPVWRGAGLFKSSDGGSSYAQIATDNFGDTMGLTLSALDTFPSGDIFDEANTVDVIISPGAQPLASASELAVLNGANEALIGSELVQFKNAALTGTRTYTLSGLLRGRRGTEWALSTHQQAGQRFVMLPPSVDIDAPPADFNAPRLYKAVTIGSALASATAIGFTNTGQGARPYSPVLLGGGCDASGNVTLTWTRRTRTGGQWSDFIEVPVSEATEAYVVQIYNSTYTQIARVITGLASPTAAYTSAQQVTDFGAQQQNIYFGVAQLGAYGLGQEARDSVGGLGGSDGNPLNPVPPYSGPPGGGGGGGSTCSGTVQSDTWLWGGGSAPRITFPGFAPGVTWLIDFTTGATDNVQGHFEIYEFGGPPAPRSGALSLSPCGVPVASFAAFAGEVAPSMTFHVGSGNPHPSYIVSLAVNTKYYLYVTTSMPSAAAFELHH